MDRLPAYILISNCRLRLCRYATQFFRFYCAWRNRQTNRCFWSTAKSNMNWHPQRWRKKKTTVPKWMEINWKVNMQIQRHQEARVQNIQYWTKWTTIRELFSINVWSFKNNFTLKIRNRNDNNDTVVWIDGFKNFIVQIKFESK